MQGSSLDGGQLIGEGTVRDAQGIKAFQALVATINKEFALLQVRELPFESYLFRVSRTGKKKCKKRKKRKPRPPCPL
jgi:hypothetical protein